MWILMFLCVEASKGVIAPADPVFVTPRKLKHKPEKKSDQTPESLKIQVYTSAQSVMIDADGKAQIESREESLHQRVYNPAAQSANGFMPVSKHNESNENYDITFQQKTDKKGKTQAELAMKGDVPDAEKIAAKAANFMGLNKKHEVKIEAPSEYDLQDQTKVLTMTSPKGNQLKVVHAPNHDAEEVNHQVYVSPDIPNRPIQDIERQD